MDTKNKIASLNEALGNHESATFGTGKLKFASENGESSAPRSASAQITQANKVAARANSSAKTPTSSRAASAHAHRTPGSEAKPLSQLKPVPPPRPGLVPMLAPKMPLRK